MFAPEIPKVVVDDYERQRRQRAEKFYAEQARSEVLQCRVTAKEKALIEKSARKSGFTVSEYVRACILMRSLEPERISYALDQLGALTCWACFVKTTPLRVKITPELTDSVQQVLIKAERLVSSNCSVCGERKEVIKPITQIS